MRAWLLEYLVCPACHGALECPALAEHDQRIEQDVDKEIGQGTLTCASCRHTYPIVDGVPRMLAGDLGLGQARTADAFGWQWVNFTQLTPSTADDESAFREWISPLDDDAFDGRLILDAGC